VKKGQSLRFSPTPSIGLLGVVLVIAAGASLCSGQGNAAVLHGTVVTIQADGTHLVIPGSAITLRSNGASRQTIGDDQGQYSFTDLPAGTYAIEATAPGLTGDSSVEIAPGASVNFDLELRVETVKESITVSASAEPAIPVEPEQQASLSRSTIVNAPSKDDRADTLLPLVPGVVRGPDGLINMKGARSSQGGSLVNSASIIDPVTGNPAMNLPTDVVSEVKVIANPYDPEYGRLSGALSSVETVTGHFDSFHASVQNILVRPRKRGGDFVGIESATPRATITGPLIKDKIAFTESFEYRFIRTPVSSLPPLQRDMKFEGFTSFNQLDVNLNSRQSMTVSLTLYPQKLNYLGLNTFQPQPSTPDLHQRGYMASIQHRTAFSSDSMLISQLSYKKS
jgi:hypothetical protein